MQKLASIFAKMPLWVLLLGIVFVISLDQYTKGLATEFLQYGRPIEVFAMLDWTLLHNHGGAFSFLSDQGGWQRWFFTIFSSLVSIILLIWMYRLPQAQWLSRFSLLFIIAGALGNLYDRIVLGYVIDFISFHWNRAYFPAFNIADAAISLGTFLMIIDTLFYTKNDDKSLGSVNDD